MQVSELVEMLRPLDIVLPSGSAVQGGTADVQLTIQGLSSSPVSAGTVTVNHTRLAGFDLGSKLQNVARLTGVKLSPNTDLERFHTNFRVGAEGTAIEQLIAVAPAIGELTGGGTIGPDHGLDFKMRAVVHTEGTVLAALGRKSDASIPFFIKGTSANPEFHPDVAAIASKEMQNLPETVEKVKSFSDAIQGLFTKKPK
jgi:AsmA protein